MPSPFPGMDPYLEAPAIWPDFHTTFLVAIRAELNHRLPPGYAARADRYIWLHEPEASERLMRKPDVYVAESERPQANGPNQSTTLAAPVTVALPAVRREGNRYLKIVDQQNHRVVTVMELLSPSNKGAGEDRQAYLMKRSEYLANGINLVEIDLLRWGARMPFGDPPPVPADYYILISRAWEYPHAGIWPLSVRNPLPPIPIPLLQQIPDTLLPLQSCFEKAFDDGRYNTEINYAGPPVPPLAEPDAAWARELLARNPQ